MRREILLCGEGEDAETAASWAAEQARDARYTLPAADRYARRVKAAYEEACRALIGRGGEQPLMKITLKPDCLSPRFAMVDGVSPSGLQALRGVRVMEILRAREARKTRRASMETVDS